MFWKCGFCILRQTHSARHPWPGLPSTIFMYINVGAPAKWILVFPWFPLTVPEPQTIETRCMFLRKGDASNIRHLFWEVPSAHQRQPALRPSSANLRSALVNWRSNDSRCDGEHPQVCFPDTFVVRGGCRFLRVNSYLNESVSTWRCNASINDFLRFLSCYFKLRYGYGCFEDPPFGVAVGCTRKRHGHPCHFCGVPYFKTHIMSRCHLFEPNVI